MDLKDFLSSHVNTVQHVYGFSRHTWIGALKVRNSVVNFILSLQLGQQHSHIILKRTDWGPAADLIWSFFSLFATRRSFRQIQVWVERL